MKNGKTAPVFGPKEKPAETLFNLASRLCPNPALTPAGTLMIILDGMTKIDSTEFAKYIARAIKGKELDGDPGAIPDAVWNAAPVETIRGYLEAAEIFKLAICLMGGDL